MPKSEITPVNQTAAGFDIQALRQRIKNIDINTIKMKKGRALTGVDPDFEWSKEKLKSLSKHEEFLPVFSQEMDGVLKNLEVIRQIYAKNEEKIAAKLTNDLERNIGNTLRGLEYVQNTYLDNPNIENFADLTKIIKEDIEYLEKTEKKLLEEIQGINIEHENMIKTIIREEYDGKDLDDFYAVIQEHYDINLGQEHGKYIKKQLLENKSNAIQQALSELNAVFPSLNSFAQKEMSEEADSSHSIAPKLR